MIDYFLASENAFIGPKNTKNSKDVVFLEKRIFFELYKIFDYVLFPSFWKYFFQIQRQKLNTEKLLNRLKTLSVAAPRIASTTLRIGRLCKPI
jgi:hypothetical protein